METNLQRQTEHPASSWSPVYETEMRRRGGGVAASEAQYEVAWATGSSSQSHDQTWTPEVYAVATVQAQSESCSSPSSASAGIYQIPIVESDSNSAAGVTDKSWNAPVYAHALRPRALVTGQNQESSEWETSVYEVGYCYDNSAAGDVGRGGSRSAQGGESASVIYLVPAAVIQKTSEDGKTCTSDGSADDVLESGGNTQA